MQAETVSVGIENDGTVEKGRKVFRSTPAYADRLKKSADRRQPKWTSSSIEGMTTNLIFNLSSSDVIHRRTGFKCFKE